MAGGWMDKIKGYVKGNPEHADSAIDKVEDFVDERTGGKYAEHVDKGGDALRGQLGIPTENATAPAPPEPREPAPAPGDAGPAQSPESAEPSSEGAGDPAPAPNPMPGTDDPQETSTGEGPLTPGEPQRPGEPGGPLDPGQVPGQPTPDGETTPGEPSGTSGAGAEGEEPMLPEGGPTQQGEPESGTSTPGTPQTDPAQPGGPSQGGAVQIPTDDPTSTSQMPGGRDVPDPGEVPGDMDAPGADKELPPFGSKR
jgi:hypothetical protein